MSNILVAGVTTSTVTATGSVVFRGTSRLLSSLSLSVSDKRVPMYLAILLIVRASDTELNPGPRHCKYPCGICSKAVKWDPNQPSIACDSCSVWYHKNCLHMPSAVFEALADNSASWICCNCGLPNFSSSLFNSFMVPTINSFGSLSDPNRSSEPNSVSSSIESPIGSPQLSSSPRNNAQTSKRGTKSSKTDSIKIVVLNAQSIMAKRQDAWVLIDSCDPDIIVCSETWLNSTVCDAEVLPPGYIMYRNDRKDGYGGVLVAVKRNLGSVDISADTGPAECETKAVKIMANKQSVVVCGAYQPPN